MYIYTYMYAYEWMYECMNEVMKDTSRKGSWGWISHQQEDVEQSKSNKDARRPFPKCLASSGGQRLDLGPALPKEDRIPVEY